jgi:putative endopeptidase
LAPTAYEANKTTIGNFNNVSFVAAIGSDDRERWKMSLFTANAFYNPREHAVEVPPAMFLPPFFDVTADDALNFASVGNIIGHEIFHSLATQMGQSRNPRVQVEIDSFKAISSRLGTVDGWETSGARTYNEDIADLGGIRVAYRAWKSTVAMDPKAGNRTIDGFTPDQRFFLAFARVWRAKWTSVTAANGDVHAAYFARINGMMRQMPQFAAAFGCKEGDRMVLSSGMRSNLW